MVKNALKESGFSEAGWEDLGIELELDPNELGAINSDHSNASTCLRKCLEKWLRGLNRTWEVLGRALERIGETAAAEKIRNSCMLLIKVLAVIIISHLLWQCCYAMKWAFMAERENEIATHVSCDDATIDTRCV